MSNMKNIHYFKGQLFVSIIYHIAVSLNTKKCRCHIIDVTAKLTPAQETKYTLENKKVVRTSLTNV